jgi:predicted amidohydrolase
VLPEYHLSGWTPDDPRFAQLGEPQAWRGYLERYCALARECRVNIVPGTMLRRETDAAGTMDASPGERPALFNVAYFIDHDGNVLGSYKKKNLW